MYKATENISKNLNTLLLIVALAFLFLARSERVATNSLSYCNLTTKIEFKSDSQAIPVVSAVIPSIDWFSVLSTSNPCLFSPECSLIASFNQHITEKLNRCSINFFNVKPLLSKYLQRQLLPRNPDPEVALLG